MSWWQLIEINLHGVAIYQNLPGKTVQKEDLVKFFDILYKEIRHSWEYISWKRLIENVDEMRVNKKSAPVRQLGCFVTRTLHVNKAGATAKSAQLCSYWQLNRTRSERRTYAVRRVKYRTSIEQPFILKPAVGDVRRERLWPVSLLHLAKWA